jgi:hypothetical protein
MWPRNIQCDLGFTLWPGNIYHLTWRYTMWLGYIPCDLW